MVSGDGPAYEINGSFSAAEEKLSINFSEAKTKFSLSLHCNRDNNYLYVNKTQIHKFRAHDNIRWYMFCLGSVLKLFTIDEESEIS